MWGFRRARTPQIFVHVGLPKCGSSSIQAYLADHDLAHACAGVVYPSAGRSPHGYRSHRPLQQVPPDALAGQLEQMAAQAPGARAIVISCESWADMLPGGIAPALAPALDQVFGARQVTVLAWFRNPVSFLESAYAQFLLGGLLNVPKPAFFAPDAPAPGLDRFVTAATQVKGFAPYDYPGWIGALEHVFAGMRIVPRSMARADLPQGGLIGDACRVLGLPVRDVDPRHNTRRSATSLLALQYAQTQMPPRAFASRPKLVQQFELSTAATWGPQDQRHRDLHVGRDLLARLKAQITQDRSALERRFATPVEGLLRLPEDAGPLSRRALDSAEQAEVLDRFQAPHDAPRG